MWHKPCRTFHPWSICIKTRCLCTLRSWFILQYFRNFAPAADDTLLFSSAWAPVTIFAQINVPFMYFLIFPLLIWVKSITNASWSSVIYRLSDILLLRNCCCLRLTRVRKGWYPSSIKHKSVTLTACQLSPPYDNAALNAASIIFFFNTEGLSKLSCRNKTSLL